jgi:transcriptional regulator GlxA family with amidase domain
LLAEAGLLQGRRATTYPGGALVLKLKHPLTHVVFDEKVVVDGNLVTSNGGLVSYPAALALLARMTGPAAAREVGEQIYFDRLQGIAGNPAFLSQPQTERKTR